MTGVLSVIARPLELVGFQLKQRAPARAPLSAAISNVRCIAV